MHEKLKKPVRKHVIAILTTYRGTRLYKFEFCSENDKQGRFKRQKKPDFSPSKLFQ